MSIKKDKEEKLNTALERLRLAMIEESKKNNTEAEIAVDIEQSSDSNSSEIGNNPSSVIPSVTVVDYREKYLELLNSVKEVYNTVQGFVQLDILPAMEENHMFTAASLVGKISFVVSDAYLEIIRVLQEEERKIIKEESNGRNTF